MNKINENNLKEVAYKELSNPSAASAISANQNSPIGWGNLSSNDAQSQ